MATTVITGGEILASETISRQPVHIGTIFSHSWGYEQTNIDYYQVVRMTASTVWVRKIAARSVEATSSMSDQVVPQKDAFVTGDCYHQALTPNSNSIAPGGEIRKRLGYSNGKAYLPTPYGWCSVWDGRSEHRSWWH